MPGLTITFAKEDAGYSIKGPRHQISAMGLRLHVTSCRIQLLVSSFFFGLQLLLVSGFFSCSFARASGGRVITWDNVARQTTLSPATAE